MKSNLQKRYLLIYRSELNAYYVEPALDTELYCANSGSVFTSMYNVVQTPLVHPTRCPELVTGVIFHFTHKYTSVTDDH